MNRNITIENLEIDNLIKEAVTNSLSRRQQNMALESSTQDLLNLDNEALIDFTKIQGGITIRTMGKMLR